MPEDSGLLSDQELKLMRREAESGRVKNIQDTLIVRLLDEVQEARKNQKYAPDPVLLRERQDAEAARNERGSIVRWLRVAYQLNENARGFADGIECCEHRQEYGPPHAIVDGRLPLTGEEYDAKLAKKASDRKLKARQTPSRKDIEHAFALLNAAALAGDGHDLDDGTLIVLNNAVKEMDRHLPDFFED